MKIFLLIVALGCPSSWAGTKRAPIPVSLNASSLTAPAPLIIQTIGSPVDIPQNAFADELLGARAIEQDRAFLQAPCEDISIPPIGPASPAVLQGKPALLSTRFSPKLLGAMRRGLENLGRGNVRIEPEKHWFTSGRNRYRLEFWTLGSEEASVVLRFGPLFYIDAGIWRSLGPGLRRKLFARAIVVNALADSSLTDIIAYYSFPAVAAMLSERFSGRRVVDASSGDGLLALTAAKLGANQTDLVDIDALALKKARANMRANGFEEEQNFNTAQGDLTKTAALLRQLPPSPLPTVVVGSVGTWPSDYTATNADVLALAAGLPNLERVILTGYSNSAPNGGLYHMALDKALARLLGLKISRPGSWGRRDAGLTPRNRNNFFCKAFVARAAPNLAADRAAFERELAKRRSEHRSHLSTKLLRAN